MGKTLVTLLALAALWLVTVGGCQINFGGGGNQGCGTNCGDLDVPYREQDNSYFCGPASILMWRLYDGLPEISQAQIANVIGCNVGQGASKAQITSGVTQFTSSGQMAVFDLGPNQGPIADLKGKYFAAEIDSIGDGIPFIAYIVSGLHAVVVTGGRWQRSGDYYRWDTVRFHDPIDGADLEMITADWEDDTFGQGHTIHSAYVNGAAANFNLHGWRVSFYGDPGGGSFPPAY